MKKQQIRHGQAATHLKLTTYIRLSLQELEHKPKKNVLRKEKAQHEKPLSEAAKAYCSLASFMMKAISDECLETYWIILCLRSF